MKEKIEAYYLKQVEPNKSCLLTLRTIIKNYDIHISEEWKYGLPSFYYKKKPFCYLWKNKKTQEPYIGIARGFLIEHTELIQGDRKRIKKLPITPTKDIPIKKTHEIFKLAISTYK
tara:strand:- start:3880 stop:4227 length:348 start_codon:yes stop_codon:yes gene_type:complete